MQQPLEQFFIHDLFPFSAFPFIYIYLSLSIFFAHIFIRFNARKIMGEGKGKIINKKKERKKNKNKKSQRNLKQVLWIIMILKWDHT